MYFRGWASNNQAPAPKAVPKKRAAAKKRPAAAVQRPAAAVPSDLPVLEEFPSLQEAAKASMIVCDPMTYVEPSLTTENNGIRQVPKKAKVLKKRPAAVPDDASELLSTMVNTISIRI